MIKSHTHAHGHSLRLLLPQIHKITNRQTVYPSNYILLFTHNQRNELLAKKIHTAKHCLIIRFKTTRFPKLIYIEIVIRSKFCWIIIMAMMFARMSASITKLPYPSTSMHYFKFHNPHRLSLLCRQVSLCVFTVCIFPYIYITLSPTHFTPQFTYNQYYQYYYCKFFIYIIYYYIISALCFVKL